MQAFMWSMITRLGLVLRSILAYAGEELYALLHQRERLLACKLIAASIEPRKRCNQETMCSTQAACGIGGKLETFSARC